MCTLKPRGHKHTQTDVSVFSARRHQININKVLQCVALCWPPRGTVINLWKWTDTQNIRLHSKTSVDPRSFRLAVFVSLSVIAVFLIAWMLLLLIVTGYAQVTDSWCVTKVTTVQCLLAQKCPSAIEKGERGRGKHHCGVPHFFDIHNCAVLFPLDIWIIYFSLFLI